MRRVGWVTAILLGSVLLAQASPRVMQVDGAGIQRELARRKGRVVVLNLWATWCAPCRAEFPALVKLHNTYRNRGVDVLAVSVDDIADEAKVVEFLKQQKATMPAFIKKPGDAERFINAIDPQWSGAVPYTVVYDRKGKPFARLLGEHTFAQFESTVKRALARR
ncbi:MAG: TlpA disulfide reductase family protein [Armatimonadota bacterium]|nr:TlpA family protein disulfide reductase [Armatimonadota bacterium]MDW8104186.1 TlpA disulfide reductase family protein [Armatimonadota bacterium]MDW8290254.1 TlpA disulfide reductase family protein [Armatimonadota bacterium]